MASSRLALVASSSTIAPFFAAYPGGRVEMVLEDRLQDLIAGGFDLAVRIGDLGRSGSVVARRLATVSGVLCASLEYIERRGMPQVPADLLAHDTLLYTYGAGGKEWTLDGPAGRARIAVTPSLLSNNSLALREAALAGAGVLRVLPEWRLPSLDVHAVYPGRSYVPLKARVFVEFLQSRFGELPHWERGAASAAEAA